MQTKIYVITKYSSWDNTFTNELICTNPKKVIEYVNSIQDIDINYYCSTYNKDEKLGEHGYLFKTKWLGRIDLT